MNFRTDLITPKSSWQISHEDFILSAGSCFAEMISERFARLHFKTVGNPFGIIYNPLNLSGNFTRILARQEYDPDLTIENRKFFHYRYHSHFYADTAEDLRTKITETERKTGEDLTRISYLILTLGTAFVYFLKELNVPVANCHKMPGRFFEKKMLNTEDIAGTFSRLISQLTAVNSAVRIILTVSPVRHIKDTLELNSVSKAVLRLACYELTEKFPDRIAYFPSYEIMMDDLRDYRFYKEDMIHPSPVAENYIWEKFAETYFSRETLSINKEITEIITSLNHKPFHPESSDYRQFLEKLKTRAEKINDKVSVKSLIENLALKLETYCC